MSSDIKRTRCIYCSLCCEVTYEREDDKAIPSQEEGRFCARACVVADLSDHPLRSYVAELRRKVKLEPTELDEVVGWLKKELEGAEENAAVLLDGNTTNENLSAGVRFAREVIGTENLAIYLPSSDEALLDGICTTQASLSEPEGLRDCDVILAIGDPFSSHPVVSEPVLKAKSRTRGNELITIDSINGRTAKFATRPILVKPGQEAEAVASILKAVDAGSIPDELPVEVDLGEVAERIKSCSKLGIVVSCPEGRTMAVDALGACIAKLAELTSAVFVPLFTYGNAVGAYSAKSALGVESFAALITAEKFRSAGKLVCIGLNLRVLGVLDTRPIVWAGSIRPPRDGRIIASVPLAMWFEESGTFTKSNGGSVELSPVIEPPKGAIELRELLACFGATADQTKLELARRTERYPSVIGTLSGEKKLSLSGGEVVCVPLYDATCLYDASLSSLFSWSREIQSEPVIYLSEEDSASAGVPRGGRVRLSGVNGHVVLLAEVSPDIPNGVAGVTPSFRSTEKLFTPRVDSETGKMIVSPCVVKVQKETESG